MDHGKYCNLKTATTCVGHAALLKHRNPVRPLQINGNPIPEALSFWDPEDQSGQRIGRLSSGTWSPNFRNNVAIGIVGCSHWDAGTNLIVQTPDGPRDAIVKEKFWLR